MAKRRSQGGVPTSHLVLSAYVGDDADVFPLVLFLYVAPGAVVVDAACRGGDLWRAVAPNVYHVLVPDPPFVADGRRLPYPDASIDAVVFDQSRLNTPPEEAAQFARPVPDPRPEDDPTLAGADDAETVLNLHFGAAREAWRVLRHGGVYIVKCRDQVWAGRQRLTHVALINELTTYGFFVIDLFVVVQRGRVGRNDPLTQAPVCLNHAYFLVFLKGKKRWKGLVDRLPAPALPRGATALSSFGRQPSLF